MPQELRQWLAELLAERGFGDIIAVTEDLNFRLEESGLQLTIGKSAVGDVSKALKDQREAFAMAETLLGDMDIKAESDMHNRAGCHQSDHDCWQAHHLDQSDNKQYRRRLF